MPGQGEALSPCGDPHTLNSGLQMSFYAFMALTWFPISTDGLQKVISVLHLAKLGNINFLQTSRHRLKKPTLCHLHAQLTYAHSNCPHRRGAVQKSCNSIPRLCNCVLIPISCHTSMHFLPQLFFYLEDLEVYNPQVSKNPIILVLYLCH